MSGKTRLLTLLLLLAAVCQVAMGAPVVSRAHADSLASRQVEFRGRTVPFSTVAREFTLKVSGTTHIGEATAEQFLASLILYPEEWSRVPFIRVKSNGIREAIKTRRKYISPASLYDGAGRYVPDKLFRGDGSAFDKELLKLDEKAVLIAQAWDGTLFTPLAENSGQLRPESSIRLEMLYYKADPWKWFFISAFAISATGLLWRKRGVMTVLVALLSLWGIAAFGVRWLIAGYPPFNGSSNTMAMLAVFTALACLIPLAAPVMPRGVNRVVAASVALVMAGCFALSGWLSSRDPQLTGLMPALASRWLPIHVSLVMGGYALLAFTAPVAIVALARPEKGAALEKFSRMMLKPGCVLLLAGIITGSVWAKEAWGSYWSWDPKENWAAVTLLLYSLPLLLPRRRGNHPKSFHIYMLVCLCSMAMTYFGVNYLNSVHAYR